MTEEQAKNLNQFLFEQEGGDTTPIYGCFADSSPEPMSCAMDTGEFHNCVYAKEGFDKTVCENWKETPLILPDFSLWDNFGRLVKIADKRSVGLSINFWSGKIYCGEADAEDFDPLGCIESDRVVHYDDIPKITAELIGKALGYKEKT